ncbi:hypothetical protein BD413DRAFT_616522 [Trametes elegans]|nr:hypothetical protein BD413DRAFT_616522 [Trametes elegans]
MDSFMLDDGTAAITPDAIAGAASTAQDCFLPDSLDDEVDSYLLKCGHSVLYSTNSPLSPDSNVFDPFEPFDWSTAFSPSALSLTPPASSTSPLPYTPSNHLNSPPLSPASDTTLVDTFPLPLLKDWDPSDWVDTVNEYRFTFVSEAQSLSHASPTPSSGPQSGYELRPLQHASRAAAADVHYPESEREVDSPYLQFDTEPTPPSPTSSIDTPGQGGDGPDDEDYVPAAATRKAPAKRRRVQDNTRQHPCDECERVFARKNNLKKHKETVHERRRPFACDVPRCGMQFGRRHDLERHHQSKHTTLGSPRRKPALK